MLHVRCSSSTTSEKGCYCVGFNVQGLKENQAVNVLNLEYTCQTVKITATGDLSCTCAPVSLFELVLNFSPSQRQLVKRCSVTRKLHREKKKSIIEEKKMSPVSLRRQLSLCSIMQRNQSFLLRTSFLFSAVTFIIWKNVLPWSVSPRY